MAEHEAYEILGVNLAGVRNRNELRIIEKMREIIADMGDLQFDALDIEDIYALVLNNLPARYAHKGSIVLREKVTEKMIRDEIKTAITVVRARPSHG